MALTKVREGKRCGWVDEFGREVVTSHAPYYAYGQVVQAKVSWSSIGSVPPHVAIDFANAITEASSFAGIVNLNEEASR